MTEILVQINNLSKTFPNRAAPVLDSINATVAKGTIMGVVGPDGAGKTTLIRLMTGLLLPTTGSITICGYDTVTQAQEIHQRIGYMPQQFGLYDDLTVQQNLNLYADLRGVLDKDKSETFERLLAFTNLAPFTNRLALNLSGGMKQKLGLACAMIQKPAVLLLDEPTNGVDPISRREFWKMVKELLASGISVVWNTSYLDEAERCETVLLLNEGKTLYLGPPSGLTKRVEGRVFRISNIPGSRRQLLEEALKQENVIDGVIQGADIHIVVKKVSDPLLDLSAIEGGETLKFTPARPSFENAFIDILGGGPRGVSLLAQQTPRLSPNRLGESVVETQGLTKRFGSFTAASDVTLNVKRGEVFGLIGPNGAGKSTTFKMMCGLLKPTSGQAFVEGMNLQVEPQKASTHIGYMAQKFSLYGNLSVEQNLIFFSGIYNLTGRNQRQRIAQMIDIFSLQPYLAESADAIPVGFKQRLALSCALMHRPEVIFLDEPTSGVDPITRREFWSHINGMVEKGVTVMVTTHYMDEAEYCDRIALVYRSKIIYMGTPDALKESVKTAENLNPTLEDAFVQLIEEYDRHSPT